MKIVIIGAGGRLGSTLMRAYRDKFEIVGFDHKDLDLTSDREINDWIRPLEFDVLINAAAYTNVDLCESKREEAFRVNAEAPKTLASICTEKGAKLIHFSTDYVFDGEKREPYAEDDPANPISAYGESKRAGEDNVLETSDHHLIVRVSWVFGPERPSFIDAMIKRAREEETIDAVSDKYSTPTYTHDIAEMLPKFFPWNRLPADMLENVDKMPMPRILHFANAGQCSWQEYAQHALDCCSSLGIPLKAKVVGATKMADMKNWVARRPVYSVLSTEKFSALTGVSPRSWREAVAEYIELEYSKK